MTKAKTNALDALRALIATRQQYEQWTAALENKRDGTPEHVFERVLADYRARLDRVIGEIRGHADELQLSISTLSSRLVEVAREEDTRREGLQEAELRAAVGEYQPAQWEQVRIEAERELEKIGADRASLDSQLGELRAIQKLSEVGSTQAPDTVPVAGAAESAPEARPASEAEVRPSPVAEDQKISQSSAAREAAAVPAAQAAPLVTGHRSGTSAASGAAPFSAPAAAQAAAQAASQAAAQAAAQADAPAAAPGPVSTSVPAGPTGGGSAASVPPSSSPATPSRPRSVKTPPGGAGTMRPRTEAGRPDQSKTLKCPECGTPNYPTEWYCERCGGELATM